MDIKYSILGATGYTGAELPRIISNHQVRPLFRPYPHLNQFYHDKMISIKEEDQIAAKSDVVFALLPAARARYGNRGTGDVSRSKSDRYGRRLPVL